MYVAPVREDRVTVVITARIHRAVWACVDPLYWAFLPGPRRDDLANYWAHGPFVRSFILLVDPEDICPPQRASSLWRFRPHYM
jgi:hypothetical protein